MKKVIALILIFALMPSAYAASDEAEECRALIEKVNDYWIKGHPNPPGYSWDNAAYYTGCMEAYYLTGIEAYREYAKAWAEKNKWSGDRTSDKSKWSSSNVYNADNQTAFQVYIDLYNLEPEEKKIARALDVTRTQMESGKSDYWTWCDALYMAMPVYSKLYVLTGDKSYLDALYRFFRYAKETMYDGHGGINYEGEPVNLFFRDPGYIKSRIDGQKNIWARGTGWVMAAFARVFSDVDEDWEYYDYFMDTYKEMAESCRRFVKCDVDGRMYYTQSVIPMYPTNSENPFGYETSGTAFIAYSILWGINSGILPREEYAPLAEGLIKYIKDIAIQPNGRVGYTQPIGAAATKAVGKGSTYNFGTGAVLMALCEAVRYYDGQEGDLYPYLSKKCVSSVALKPGSQYAYDGKKVICLEAAPFIENGRTMVPLSASELFGSKKPINTKTVGKIKYAELRETTEEKLYWNEKHKIIVVGKRSVPFYDCDSALLDMLDGILTEGKLPERAPQNERDFVINASMPALPGRIKFASIYSEDIPEVENGPENAADDDLDTRWAAINDPEIIFDIGKIMHIEKIALAFWQNDVRTTAYELFISTDGVTYSLIEDNSSKKGEIYDYISVGRDVRYIKLIGHGNSSGNGWTSLLELAALEK